MPLGKSIFNRCARGLYWSKCKWVPWHSSPVSILSISSTQSFIWSDVSVLNVQWQHAVDSCEINNDKEEEQVHHCQKISSNREISIYAIHDKREILWTKFSARWNKFQYTWVKMLDGRQGSHGYITWRAVLEFIWHSVGKTDSFPKHVIVASVSSAFQHVIHAQSNVPSTPDEPVPDTTTYGNEEWVERNNLRSSTRRESMYPLIETSTMSSTQSNWKWVSGPEEKTDTNREDTEHRRKRLANRSKNIGQPKCVLDQVFKYAFGLPIYVGLMLGSS